MCELTCCWCHQKFKSEDAQVGNGFLPKCPVCYKEQQRCDVLTCNNCGHSGLTFDAVKTCYTIKWSCPVCLSNDVNDPDSVIANWRTGKPLIMVKITHTLDGVETIAFGRLGQYGEEDIDTSMKHKQNFNQMVDSIKSTKPLKQLCKDTPLPYVFDLHWDAKYGRDLEQLKNNDLVKRHLAECGFDVNKWLNNLKD